MIYVLAALYVLSGVCQPLIMTLCKVAGLADPKAQLYMVFYSAGPSLLAIGIDIPQNRVLWKAVGVSLMDILAQAMNYTGASLAGPTIFAIVYSSVTVWTAVFSRVFLKRSLEWLQWFAVWVVFGGLVLTATHSVAVGPDVGRGTLLILVGSCLHAGMYVMSEAIMREGLTARQNSSWQAIVGLCTMVTWQVLYTLPRWDEVILEPAEAAGTTLVHALSILLAFGLANMVHSLSFFNTLKDFPGGATSAGVMKGLQAVLVFVVADLAYCGRYGGSEMCFSESKFASLVTVVCGVTLFGVVTERQHRESGYHVISEESTTAADIIPEIADSPSVVVEVR